jgi:hypothetical protein
VILALQIRMRFLCIPRFSAFASQSVSEFLDRFLIKRLLRLQILIPPLKVSNVQMLIGRVISGLPREAGSAQGMILRFPLAGFLLRCSFVRLLEKMSGWFSGSTSIS